MLKIVWCVRCALCARVFSSFIFWYYPKSPVNIQTEFVAISKRASSHWADAARPHTTSPVYVSIWYALANAKAHNLIRTKIEFFILWEWKTSHYRKGLFIRYSLRCCVRATNARRQKTEHGTQTSIYSRTNKDSFRNCQHSMLLYIGNQVFRQNVRECLWLCMCVWMIEKKRMEIPSEE